MSFQRTQNRKKPWLAAILAFFVGGPGCFYLGWQIGLAATLIWLPLFTRLTDKGDFALLLLQGGFAAAAAKICAVKNARLESQPQAELSRQTDLSQPGSRMPAAVPRAPMSPLRKCVVFAASLFVIDAFFLNQGIFSGVVAFVAFCCIPVALWSLVRKDTAKFRLQMKQIGIVMAGCFAVFGMNWLQNQMADRRAVELGTACLEFRDKTHHYPGHLHDLVPSVIPAVPPAKYTFMSSDFFYMIGVDGEPEIYYVVMPPFGRRFYHVEKGTWGFMD